MNVTLRERFLTNPDGWGACFGAIILSLVQLLVIFVLCSVPEGFGTLIYSFGYSFRYTPPLWVLLPAAFWGCFLGSYSGKAWRHWIHERQNLARRTLLRVGVWCTLINGAWMLFRILVFALFLNEINLSVVIYNFLPNVCLQTSVLFVAASFLLPRREEERVQVTENLRL